MIVTFYTKDGSITRPLTRKELVEWAKNGNDEAKRELLKESWATMNTAGKIQAMAKMLGVETWDIKIAGEIK